MSPDNAEAEKDGLRPVTNGSIVVLVGEDGTDDCEGVVTGFCYEIADPEGADSLYPPSGFTLLTQEEAELLGIWGLRIGDRIQVNGTGLITISNILTRKELTILQNRINP